MEKTKPKFDLLKNEIRGMEKVMIAFSGGVDSTFLLKVCFDVLGYENVLAVTAKSPIRFAKSIKKAKEIADLMGVRHITFESCELDNNNFVQNNKERCYYCKYELYSRLNKLAEEKNIENVLDGTNYDDSLKNNRPGMKVLSELDIKTPLKEVELKKSEIRELSRELGLSTWEQPSDTCLATRFNYSLEIDKKNLERIRSIELFLRKFKFEQLRVRLHDQNTVRIEVLPEDMDKLIENRDKIINKLKKVNFNYITIDLEGYRSGSMDEVSSES